MQLIWINSGAASRDIGSKMGTFIFKCPTTGFNVQGFVAEDVGAGAADNDWVSIKCAVCTQIHLVHPVSGKVLGSDDE
jgi:hypothetical protein